MPNRNYSDNGGMPRWTINIRKATYDELDSFREVLEPGKSESWDTFLRRLMRERKLERPKG